MGKNRIAALRRVLMTEKKVNCADLCQRFQVSMPTIRRDLDILEREGTIRRFYGGAELIDSKKEGYLMEIVPEWDIREVASATEKHAIARKVVSLIPDNSTIFLDSGTTVYEVAKLLTQRSGLTVVTGALRNASLLGMCPNIETYCIGGNIRPNMLFATGLLAVESLSYFPTFDYYVLAADGISPYGSIHEWSTENAILKRTILSRSKTTIVVADHSKFSVSVGSSVCQLKDIDSIVTDNGIDPAMVSQMQSKGVNLILAD